MAEIKINDGKRAEILSNVLRKAKKNLEENERSQERRISLKLKGKSLHKSPDGTGITNTKTGNTRSRLMRVPTLSKMAILMKLKK